MKTKVSKARELIDKGDINKALKICKGFYCNTSIDE